MTSDEEVVPRAGVEWGMGKGEERGKLRYDSDNWGVQFLFDGSGWGCFVGVSMLVVVVKGKLRRRPFPTDGGVTMLAPAFHYPVTWFHKGYDNRLYAI